MTLRPPLPARLRAPRPGWSTAADVIVVGSGIAGLTVALTARTAGHSVLLVTKAQLEAGSTRWAQGGIAAALGEGDTPEQHLEVLSAHAPDLRLDVVVADVSQVANPGPLEAAAAKLGAEVVLAPVAMTDGSPRHDPVLLAAAYERVLGRDRIAPWR